MLTSVRIQNFKCLRDAEVQLGPITVLIGKNDTGKSSFLQSFDLLRRLVQNESSIANTVHRQARAGSADPVSWRLAWEGPFVTSSRCALSRDRCG